MNKLKDYPLTIFFRQIGMVIAPIWCVDIWGYIYEIPMIPFCTQKERDSLMADLIDELTQLYANRDISVKCDTQYDRDQDNFGDVVYLVVTE